MKYLVFDIEATKVPKVDPWIKGAYICSIGIKTSDGVYRDWLFNHVKEKCCDHAQAIKEIQQLIDDADIIVAHNAKFDINWFRTIGLNVDNVDVWCTMMGEYLLYGQNPLISLSLNATAARRKLGQKHDKMFEYWAAGFETDEIPWSTVQQIYLQQDVELTEKIFKQQFPELKKSKLLKLQMLCCRVSKVLSTMELNGVDFNVELAQKYYEDYLEKIKEYEVQLVELVGVQYNTASDDQLRAVLFGGTIKTECQELVAVQRKNETYRVYTRKCIYEKPVKGLGFGTDNIPRSKKTGRLSTSKKALAWLVAETPEQERFLEIEALRSTAAKFCSTIHSKDADKDSGLVCKTLSSKDGKLHPTFNQCITVTGRLSSANPNGQNFSRYSKDGIATGKSSPLKLLIESKNGYIVNADLSQIEWRIAASESQDSLMCQEICDGVDAHGAGAVKYFKVKGKDDPDFKKARQSCKTLNFRMIYGGGPAAFYRDASMPRYSLKEYRSIVKKFYENYSGLRAWQLSNETIVNKNGHITNPSGRYITFKFNDGSEESDYKVGYSLPDICNYPVQSASADIMFLCLDYINNELLKRKMKTKLLLQVHDSVVADCPKEEVYEFGRICLDAFRSVVNMGSRYFGWAIRVPITGEISIGKNYGEALAEYKEKEFTPEAIDALLNGVIV